MRLWKVILNFFFPMCIHSGHRMEVGYVKNMVGGMYCWHGDCMKASLREVYEADVKRRSSFNYWNC
jgi:hypothetical protein